MALLLFANSIAGNDKLLQQKNPHQEQQKHIK